MRYFWSLRVPPAEVSSRRAGFFPSDQRERADVTKLRLRARAQRRQKCAGFDKGCSTENRNGGSIYAALHHRCSGAQWFAHNRHILSCLLYPQIPRRTQRRKPRSRYDAVRSRLFPRQNTDHFGRETTNRCVKRCFSASPRLSTRSCGSLKSLRGNSTLACNCVARSWRAHEP